MRRHQGTLRVDIIDDLRSRFDDPSSGGHFHPVVALDVSDPVRTPRIRGDHDEPVAEAFAWEEDLAREATLPAACREKHPARSALEVATKRQDQETLCAIGESRDEMQAREERLRHVSERASTPRFVANSSYPRAPLLDSAIESIALRLRSR